MTYDFDRAVDRRGTNCLKYDFARERGRSEELLPLWVADMDFETAPCVKQRLKEAVEHGIYVLLCSPHNPVGRVWEEGELKKVGEICLRHGVLVVSDEIHSDFVWPGNRHRVFASLDPAFSRVAVTCTAPSKTFNLAGLQISNIFIENAMLRKKFLKAVAQAGYRQVGLFGLLACQAAYEEGQEWLEELDAYLYENLLFVRSYLQKHIPEVKLIEPEGTYLVWLDFRGLSLSGDELEALIVRKAKLWLDSGRMFGPDGEGFQRMNIACPRSVLQKALEQLDRAVRTNAMIPDNY